MYIHERYMYWTHQTFSRVKHRTHCILQVEDSLKADNYSDGRLKVYFDEFLHSRPQCGAEHRMLHVGRVTRCVDVSNLVSEAVGALFKQLIGFVYDEPLDTALGENITISHFSWDTQSSLLGK